MLDLIDISQNLKGVYWNLPPKKKVLFPWYWEKVYPVSGICLFSLMANPLISGTQLLLKKNSRLDINISTTKITYAIIKWLSNSFLIKVEQSPWDPSSFAK